MTDQLTEADMLTENEAICEKLLGWKRLIYTTGILWEHPPTGVSKTPAFDNWSDAGLILDALKAAGEKPRVFVRADDQWGCMGWGCGGVGSTAFAAIRSAALEYIRSRP